MTCGRLITALGLLMLVAVATTASAGPLVDSTGLVLYYNFDGMTDGVGGVKDGSANGADGTIVRDVTMDYGLLGGAAKFGPRVLSDVGPDGLCKARRPLPASKPGTAL